MSARGCLVPAAVRLFSALALTATAGGAAIAAADEPPRLVLQITVDALRADLPQRYLHEMGDGGFRLLMEQGVHYRNAAWSHANTETIVGHASLATGAYPADHGMIGNLWFDRTLGRTVYNIEDPDYVLLTAGATVDASTEIDPTQRAAKVEGRSPRAILASTFSDELMIATQGRAKVFGVSVKDRGAVSMAGHMGQAYWFSKSTGEFVTSSYYRDRYPAWVEAFNAAGPATAYAGTRWTLMNAADSYLFGAMDDQPFETDFPGYGRTFPHAYGDAGDKYLTTRLTLGPAGDRMTLEFARTLIREEALGQDAVPDYLSVSFSSNDYVSHVFGASSLEHEDNLLRLDATLAELFAHVDETVGLEHTLIVLSADHGTPEVPGYLNELGQDAARYFDLEGTQKGLTAALEAQFGAGETLIESWSMPYLYLNDSQIAAAGLDKAEVEGFVCSYLLGISGVAQAVSTSALRGNRVAPGALTQAVRHNDHVVRSGDIYLVLQPEIFVNDFDGLTVASHHGSPWHYDRAVPVIFAGAGLAPQRVDRPVTPYDIAATLSAVLGIAAPSASAGRPLEEVTTP
ncbi:MAG: alkaline phosphatase family protein [Pseudomonadales bacterium]|jgi:predicted AlkP superfamily pyrophosphatase or phosphodiesterase|nr:alkaline phosphatase family protein [Pseudomonadales bacterium]